MLTSLVSLSPFNLEADQHLCLGSNLYNFQITARDVKVKNIKGWMNKGVATPTVVTFSRHVVDLQPIQNGFLYFFSINRTVTICFVSPKCRNS